MFEGGMFRMRFCLSYCSVGVVYHKHKEPGFEPQAADISLRFYSCLFL